jgi:hypothetical protein
MFRRPIRRAMVRSMMNPVPPALQRANRLIAENQFSEAAGIFEQFAKGAMMRGGPRAPWFFIQAGHANILAGSASAGLEQIQTGLNIFKEHSQMQQIYQVGTRIVNDLNSRGLKAEAVQVEDAVKKYLPAGFTPGAGLSAKKPRVLPTSCPGCGGPIRSDEVEWADELTAECPFCGSSIRAE